MIAVNLAQDFCERGITVLAFHPGWVQTDMGGRNALNTPQEAVAGMCKQIASAGPDQSGKFFNYDGESLHW